MSTLLKFSNNIICDCPRQCLREDGHVWFRHFFHGQRSTRINIYHCCSVLYCWCLCTCCFSYLPSLQFVVPSNKINVTEHVPIEHNGRESNICCVITYLCSNFVPFSYLSFLFLTSLLTFLLSGLVHLIKKTFCSLLTFLNVATRRG